MKKRLAFGARYKVTNGFITNVCIYNWWRKEEFKMEQLYGEEPST